MSSDMRTALLDALGRYDVPPGPERVNFTIAFAAGWNAAATEARADSAVPSSHVSETDHTWRCFHCDEVFADPAAACEHFGASLMQQPACQIDVAEYRRMEEANRRHCEEDTDLHREIHRLHSDHRTALVREEEKGYAKGLHDGRSESILREALARLVAVLSRGNQDFPEYTDWLEFHHAMRAARSALAGTNASADESGALPGAVQRPRGTTE